MKANLFQAKIIITIMLVLLAYNTSSAQVRYKHVPRVKVKNHKTEKPDLLEKEPLSAIFVTPVNEEVSKNVTAEASINTETTTVVSISETIVIINPKPSVPLKHHRAIKKYKTSHQHLFSQHVKENSKFLEVKDVKKTNMEKWLTWMIILFAFAVICLAVGFILLGVSYYYLTYFYVFIIIGSVFLLAGCIMPLLGLTGHWYR